MEVGGGFRATEFGWLPSDWRVSQLGSLRPYVTSGSRGWARYYSDRGAPFVRITNLSRGSIYLDLADLKHVNLPDGEREGLRTQLRLGDLLVSITADIGIVAFVDGRVPQPSFINQHIALVRFDAAAADTRFLAYFLASEPPQRAFRAGTDQGAKAGMNLAGVLKIRVAFPPLGEQRAIAAALSDVDGLLDGLDRLIAKKRDLKQASMQQLLTGRTRLPGFRGQWVTRRLGDVLTICHGKSQRDVAVEDGPFPVLASGGRIGSASRALYDKPSVLIGRKGTIDQPQYMDTPFWTVDTLFYSVIRDSHNAKFLYYWFCMVPWMKYNEASGVPSLNARTIEQVEFACPEANEQGAIAAVLSDMDADLAALEARRDKTRALKQAMIQELLTGRTRLV